MKPESARLMNWMGALGWTLICIYLVFQRMGSASAGWIFGTVATYALFIYFPVISAFAFRASATRKLQNAALLSNWLLILLLCLSVVASWMTKQPVTTLLLGVVLFILPAALNISALHALLDAPSESPKPSGLI